MYNNIDNKGLDLAFYTLGIFESKLEVDYVKYFLY